MKKRNITNSLQIKVRKYIEYMNLEKRKNVQKTNDIINK